MFINRDSRPTLTVQTTIALAPALRARSMSGVTSGWVASICAWPTTFAPSLVKPATVAATALVP